MEYPIQDASIVQHVCVCLCVRTIMPNGSKWVMEGDKQGNGKELHHHPPPKTHRPD